MAVKDLPFKDEQENEKELSQGGESPVFGQSAQGLTPSKEENQPKGSGTFVPIQKYIDANSQQGGNIASEIAKNTTREAQEIGRQVQAKQAALQSFVQQKEPEIQQARTFSESLINRSAPVSQEELQRFQSIRQGNAGLQNIPDLGMEKERFQVRQLESKPKFVESEAGRKQLLSQTFGGQGNYTKGMSILDQLVLQSRPENIQQLKTGIEQPINQLQSQIQQVETQRLADTGRIKEQAESLLRGPQSIDELINQQRTGLRSAVESQAKKYDEDLVKAQDWLKRSLDMGTINQELYEQLAPDARTIIDDLINRGVSTKYMEDIIGPNIYTKSGQPLLLQDGGLTPREYSQIATNEQIAKQRLLEQLSETGQEFLLPEYSPVRGFTAESLNLQKLVDDINSKESVYGEARQRIGSGLAQQLSDLVYNEIGQHRSAGEVGTPEWAALQNFKNNVKNQLLSGVTADQIASPILYNQPGSTKATPEDFQRVSQQNEALNNTIREQYRAKLQYLNELAQKYTGTPLSIAPKDNVSGNVPPYYMGPVNNITTKG